MIFLKSWCIVSKLFHADSWVFWVFGILSSFTCFMNPLPFFCSSSSITIRLIFISVFYSVFVFIFIVWILIISPPHPSSSKRLALPIRFWAVLLFWEFSVRLLGIQHPIGPLSSSWNWFLFFVLPSLYILFVFFPHPSILYCSWYQYGCVLYYLLYLQLAAPLLH